MPQYIYYQGKQYPVPIQYSLPKGMNAAEAGVLIDGSADSDDVLSLIYEWVNNRIIKVYSTNESIKFTKLKELPKTAKSYEQTLFNELFSGQKININKIRLEILDYCFKMEWIEDPFGGKVSCVRNGLWEKSSGRKIGTIVPYIFLAILFLTLGLFLTLFLVFSSSVMKYLIFIIIITTIVAISLECNKPAYYYLSNSTLYLYLGGKPKYSYPKCQFISLPFYKAPFSTTPLTQKGKLLQNHIAGYKQYLEKIKITTETSRIDDGTLKDRISLGVNDSGYILDSIKKYKVNKHEHAYDLLFEHKINEWIANWEKEHNWKLSYYGEI